MFETFILQSGFNSSLPKCSYAWVRLYSQVRTLSRQVCFYRSQLCVGGGGNLSQAPLSAYAMIIIRPLICNYLLAVMSVLTTNKMNIYYIS